MTPVAVQLPDELYWAARRLAEDHEITLAEVVRRGLEHMLRIYPPSDSPSGWQPPAPRHLGRFRTPEDQWREIANEQPWAAG